MNIELSSAISSIENIIDSLKNKEGSLLPILHAIQSELGYIPEQAIDRIAKKLQQTPVEIYGVISFYHQFKTSPSAKHKIQVCRAEACQARGSRQLEQQIKNHLNINFNESTSDNKFSLDSIYCLGNCATGPNIRINNDLYGRITEHKFKNIMGKLNDKDKDKNNA